MDVNDTPQPSRTRLLLLGLLVTGLLLLLIEGGLSWLYAFTKGWERSAPIAPEEAHARYDADLGWSHVPSLHIEDLYGGGQHFTSNAQGFRATEDFSPSVPEGRRRVLFLGDSFTMGVGVGDHATFPAQVLSITSVSIAPAP